MRKRRFEAVMLNICVVAKRRRFEKEESAWKTVTGAGVRCCYLFFAKEEQLRLRRGNSNEGLQQRETRRLYTHPLCFFFPSISYGLGPFSLMSPLSTSHDFRPKLDFHESGVAILTSHL